MDARGFAQNRASLDCMHVWHNHLKADEPAKLLSNNITALQYSTDNHVGAKLFNSTHNREACPKHPLSDIHLHYRARSGAASLSSIRSCPSPPPQKKFFIYFYFFLSSRLSAKNVFSSGISTDLEGCGSIC